MSGTFGPALLAYQLVGLALGLHYCVGVAKHPATRHEFDTWALVWTVLTIVSVWPAILLMDWMDDSDRWKR